MVKRAGEIPVAFETIDVHQEAFVLPAITRTTLIVFIGCLGQAQTVDKIAYL